jgi:Uma2 family endonuclease
MGSGSEFPIEAICQHCSERFPTRGIDQQNRLLLAVGTSHKLHLLVPSRNTDSDKHYHEWIPAVATPMTPTRTRFSSFEEYLATTEGLPEGRYEYWDGELVALMTESGENDEIINLLFLLLVQAGLSYKLVKPGRCEVEVMGTPRTRFPDLVILREEHPDLLRRRNTITRQMPPPRVVVVVVSRGKSNRERDLISKRTQYAEIGVPEYWLIDPEQQDITVLKLVNGAYVEHQVATGSDRLTSPSLGTLPISVHQLLNQER